MELNKCVFKGKHESEFYCKKNEVVNEKDYVLLGFKDNLPVLSNASRATSNRTMEITPKKTIKVEVDAQTGEKFLNLNGKKLKMVTESELPPHLKQNAQIIRSQTGNMAIPKNPVRVKIIGSMPSILHGSVKIIKSPDPHREENDKHILKSYVNKTHCSVDNSNSLSRKTMLIKGGKLPTVISSVGNVFAARGAPLNKNTFLKQDNGKLKEMTQFKLEFDKIESDIKTEIKTYQRSGSMKALDLTKLSKPKMFEDKYVQTEERIIRSQSVQTDDCLVVDERNLLDLTFDLDEFINGAITPGQSPSYTNLTDKIPLMDVPLKAPAAPQSRLNMFFNDLRGALLPDDKGNMPIHVGVLTNSISLVKKNCSLLKALQKTVDLPNHGDFTALQLSVINDSSPDILRTLLMNGASLDVTDTDGNNILHLAVELERQELLEIILKEALKRKFDLDQFNAEGFTPLMISCCKGLLRCAELLLGHGADVNLRDRKSGRTSLFHAAEIYNLSMVNLLLSYNADTKIKNFFGTSPHDAMYEVDEIPDRIKSTILRRLSKRKLNEENKIKSPKVKKKELAPKPLKTYARLKKISEYGFQNEKIDSESSSLTM